MTPIGVRLSNIRSRLRRAHRRRRTGGRGARRGIADTARHADLELFLLLASGSLSETLRADGRGRRTHDAPDRVVQGALAEQMRTTHNEHVVESVRLPELVAQTLEVVPDGARQRLQLSSTHHWHGCRP